MMEYTSIDNWLYKNEELMDMFGDWMDNFLTVERFAEHYEIEVKQAEEVINVGRKLWDKRAAQIKKTKIIEI